jgi:hypothetical protein
VTTYNVVTPALPVAGMRGQLRDRPRDRRRPDGNGNADAGVFVP